MRALLGSRGFLVVLLALFSMACGDPSSGSGGASTATVASTGTAPPAAKPHDPIAAPERAGGALMRSADGTRLYLADEDHKVLRVLPLPFAEEPPQPTPTASTSADASAAPSASAAASAASSGTPSASGAPSGSPSARPSAKPSASASAKPPEIDPWHAPPVRSMSEFPPAPPAKHEDIPMPGAPAQVLPLDGFVLVTIRDPGLLLVMKETPGNKLEEDARIPLADDAWGLAITKDEKTAVVTSAWTHKVTGVDWHARKALWTLDVAREPRGVVVHPNGKTAYVSHLTSSDLTRIDDVSTPAAKATRVPLPAAPQRLPLGAAMPASLGYALAMDDAGNRVLAARHGLAALSAQPWFGAVTVDVLQTQNDKPLLGPRTPRKILQSAPAFDDVRQQVIGNGRTEENWMTRPFLGPDLGWVNLEQPRAMAVAHRSSSVWLASEGGDVVAELTLMAAAPVEHPRRVVFVGNFYRDQKIIGDEGIDDGIPRRGGAPTGLALSADETLLYVYCRSTSDVVTLRIGEVSAQGAYERVVGRVPTIEARVADDPLDDAMSRGKRLFFGGRDGYSSGGMGCAGCHPEGRDDGQVWHEAHNEEIGISPNTNFFGSEFLAKKTHNGKLGFPRQTPMLAGRVDSTGPFGWHAQNANLLERLADGFNLHRWGSGRGNAKSWMTAERAVALAEYLRKGLVLPPRPKRELTDQEKQGKQIFESDATKCKSCHAPETAYGSQIAFPLKKLTPPAGFEEEDDDKFKAPSLRFVAGTAPYYHDGSAPTLQALIAKNADRMGNTSQLSDADKAALVAYLETL